MIVNEIFYSIQGEGILIGIPTVFVRTTGCNLRCKWCDTKYSHMKGEELTIKNIINEIKRYSTNNICLTGGEPLIQKDCNILLEELINQSFNVILETNGSLCLKDIPCSERLLISMDIKTPSSKMHEKVDFTNLEILKIKDQVKFVISDEIDYFYAKKILKKFNITQNVIFQPVDGIEFVDLVKKVMRDGLNVRILPQLHKLFNMR